VDKDKKASRPSAKHSDQPSGSSIDELYRKLNLEMGRSKPANDAIAAALEAAQRLAAEADAETAAEELVHDLENDAPSAMCKACGYRNRSGNKFCGMCGVAVSGEESEAGSFAEPRRPRAIALHPNPFLDPEPEPHDARFEPNPPVRRQGGAVAETHHYHHHYHYFTGSADGTMPRHGADPAREIEKLRPTAAMRGEMSRVEAAVRRITQEWVLACNTKHLDDLLDLYVADAMVLRSNYPLVRGAAAVREFFYGALDAGLGEVEIEPLRVEVVGELAYEAGRCKALVPSASGKRREERGKYLWVCARQSNNEWKLAVDCWSSDLSLTMLESDVPVGTTVKSSQPRKAT